jgi:excisionase family DNA binding protein
MLDKIESSLTNSKPTLNGERFLTDREVYQRLRISRSTLQEWRYSGQIPYIQIGGKILFRESDIQAMLDRNLKKSFR